MRRPPYSPECPQLTQTRAAVKTPTRPDATNMEADETEDAHSRETHEEGLPKPPSNRHASAGGAVRLEERSPEHTPPAQARAGVRTLNVPETTQIVVDGQTARLQAELPVKLAKPKAKVTIRWHGAVTHVPRLLKQTQTGGHDRAAEVDLQRPSAAPPPTGRMRLTWGQDRDPNSGGPQDFNPANIGYQSRHQVHNQAIEEHPSGAVMSRLGRETMGPREAMFYKRKADAELEAKIQEHNAARQRKAQEGAQYERCLQNLANEFSIRAPRRKGWRQVHDLGEVEGLL